MGGWIVDLGDYIVSRWVFFRLFGAIYLVAFASFAVQASGLIGSRGILPVGPFLRAVKLSLGRKAYGSYPTLLWIDASDASLKALNLAGIALSLLLLFGLNTTLVLALLWILYLSLVNAGQVFLSYQWDALLIEAGFLSIFLVPPSILPDQATGQPSFWMIFLFRWLLFRLMFMSGILKLASRDLTWRRFTALSYHYETQPLPTPLAWFFHMLPGWFQKLSTLLALIIEIAIPLFFFAPGLLRYAAAGLTIFLQLLIMFTGNFAFFNVLAIALTVFLFPDNLLLRILPAPLRIFMALTGDGGLNHGLIPGIFLALLYVSFGAVYLLRPWIRRTRFFQSMRPLLQSVAAFRLVNSYGLFTMMTTERPEIILEGSMDGQNWVPYEFKYKVGSLQRAPPVVAPHQPRLDWQMWFAALGSPDENHWFMNLVVRLLEGSPAVLRLLARNPFPENPPVFIRARLYDYEFTSLDEKAKTGTWWKREELGIYLAPVTIRRQEA